MPFQTTEGSGVQRALLNSRRASVSQSNVRSSLPSSGLHTKVGKLRRSSSLEEVPRTLLGLEESSMFIHQAESRDVLIKSNKPPKQLGPYVLGEVLGHGSYGKVREAYSAETLKRVAVKIIHFKNNMLAKQNPFLEMAQHEIRLQAKLNSKYVVKILDIYASDEKNKLYIVMEFCSTSLQDLIASSPGHRLSHQDAAHFFKQLVEGLEYLQTRGIVHRDIKPANLLLSTDGRLKISDFGIAEEMSFYEKTDSCQFIPGTPAFQAPELLSASPAATISGVKADIWAAGVTLYNMLTGGYPFEETAIHAGNKTGLKIPSIVEPLAADLLSRLLDVDPARRISLAEIKRHPWVVSAPGRTHRKPHVKHTSFVGFLERLFRHAMPKKSTLSAVGPTDFKQTHFRLHLSRFSVQPDAEPTKSEKSDRCNLQ